MNAQRKEVSSMIIDLNMKERDLLVEELEQTTIPQIRELIASGSLRKKGREELKEDEIVLKGMVEKLKKAA
jgi:hypothetical protein